MRCWGTTSYRSHRKMFVYTDEKNIREHNYVRIGLMLALAPLLSMILGIPLLVDRPTLPDSVALEPLVIAGRNTSMVPLSWLRNRRIDAGIEGRCNFTPRPDKSAEQKIQMIRVIGERNSGVDSVANLLGRMFPNVTVGTGFTRGKFWFQSESLLIHQGVRVDLSKVLVVVVLRDPISWLRHFQKSPLHSPAHVYSTKNGWRSFLSKQWTTVTSSVDQKFAAVEGAKCQARYLSGQVLPCRQSRFNMVGNEQYNNHLRRMTPVYEMNPLNQSPLNNIMELRRHKLLNYVNMTSWVPNMSFVKLDKLVQASHLSKLKQVLASHHNLDLCDSYGSTPLTLQDPSFQAKLPPISYEQLNFIKCNIDWKSEKLFGFSPGYLDPSKISIGRSAEKLARAAELSAQQVAAVGDGILMADDIECSRDPFAAQFSGHHVVGAERLPNRNHSRRRHRKG